VIPPQLTIFFGANSAVRSGSRSFPRSPSPTDQKCLLVTPIAFFRAPFFSVELRRMMEFYCCSNVSCVWVLRSEFTFPPSTSTPLRLGFAFRLYRFRVSVRVHRAPVPSPAEEQSFIEVGSWSTPVFLSLPFFVFAAFPAGSGRSASLFLKMNLEVCCGR